MKVSLDTVEVTDEQREQLANVIDGKVSKRKATRAEAKSFVWQHGDTWAETLSDMVSEDNADNEPEPAEDDDEDLLGEDDLL